MAMRFPSQFLDELRSRADIVQIVSHYVPLKQNGRRYWGLCPFHNEKTPSFSVDGEKQMYYCFGCKAGGTVIQFVMEMERLEFYEAVRYLADMVHMQLPQMEEDVHYEERRREKETLLEINREAAAFYHSQLWLKEGEEYLRYFYARGLSDKTIRRFGLGACPPKWDGLTQYLLDKGYSLDNCQKAGVTVYKNGKSYDMFRSRAMFPIIDQHSQVIAFGGRIMTDGQPKYLNTGDTPVFNKRMGVYAANLLKKARGIKRVILVEGYMDVISLSQAGIEGVAATLGTALTPEQARLLKRFAPEIWVSYDGDNAGQHAIMRALEIFEAESIPCKVLFFPDGRDPDEYVREFGLEGVEKLKPLDATTYRLMREKSKYDLSQPSERVKFAVESARILSKVKEPVELEEHLRWLETQTSFPRDVLMEQIKASGVELNAKPAIAPRKSAASYTGENAKSDGQKAEEDLLLLLSGNFDFGQAVDVEDFTDETLKGYAIKLSQGKSATEILEEEDDEQSRVRLSAILSGETPADREQAIKMAADCLTVIRRQKLSDELAELKARMQKLDGDERMEALRQAQTLVLRIQSLKQGRKE
ncbi:MAG: DNA primase [Eubacteriales bacterium]|nr:DNA primase [Eubacteriales bacterium]MDD3881554.1 DNA primase [Eubacteriales bacterium]MDD4513376.1 DNA primase [Eubacteriales bacterium]